MTTQGSNEARAKRMDRFMGFLISGGGLFIIAAVLAMLAFMAKEAIPVFAAPQTRSLGEITLPKADRLWLDESGKAAVILSREAGVQAVGLPDGTPLAPAAGGPALPWKVLSPITALGEFLVVDGEGRLTLGKVAWTKPAGESDPRKWSLEVAWQGAAPLPAVPGEILHFRPLEGGGLGAGARIRVVAWVGQGLSWADLNLEEGQAAWHPIALPAHLEPTTAVWSGDGQKCYVGTRQGILLDFKVDGTADLETQSLFGEPISALGFALGQNSLLVGGSGGALKAFQQVRKEEVFTLQPFHTFANLRGPVLGFAAGQRDKRFLAWSPNQVVVDHLTSERRLASWDSNLGGVAALSLRGEVLLQEAPSGKGAQWELQAPHPEINLRTLWGDVHYEGYERADQVWQSSGGSDDFEPKFSLVPLVFGTLKGTLYALVFAVPLALFGALYTSQFATSRLKTLIKPTIEIMAALPSVVLGFLAGLVLAPLFERMAVEILVFPLATLVLMLLLLPGWRMLPTRFRKVWGDGREVLWMIPLLLAGLGLAHGSAPFFERLWFAGNYKTWLLQTHGIAFDQRNSLVVGFAMGFAVIPIIFTISEDALSTVPKSLVSASLACGASPWQTAWRVVLPTASPGIFSAVMVGLGRAIGETMIVLMATGNTPVMSWSAFNGMRTLSANIAVEIPEAPHHGTLYRILFFTALLLFAFTFVLNTVAELVRQRLRKRYESL